jgi:glutamate-1-semialdehyde 2,1-aminomutase
MGKIIGGGLPVGAYGGKKEIMDKVSPSGPIYQAGTLSGNPLAMAAGLAMLNYLKNNPSIYKQLDKATTSLVEGLAKGCKDAGISYIINQVGSMYTLFFTDKEVVDFNSATTSDTDFFARYFQSMLNKGMYLAPSQYEAMFVSASITTGIVDQILDAHTQTLKEL